jgi:hypothetical protein
MTLEKFLFGLLFLWAFMFGVAVRNLIPTDAEWISEQEYREQSLMYLKDIRDVMLP